MGWRLRHLLEDVSSFFFSWRCSCARCSRRSWFVEASWFICEVQIWRLGFLKTHAAIVAVPLCPPNRRCAHYLSGTAIDGSGIARWCLGIDAPVVWIFGVVVNHPSIVCRESLALTKKYVCVCVCSLWL